MIYALIAVVVLIVIGISLYNGLIKARNHVHEAWADIEVQLKRRYDLIPNLIESVKGYVKQEKDVLTQVTEARASAVSAGAQGAEASAKAEGMLTETLRSLFAVAENYPDLKSSENFQQLSSELSDTENKIQAARRFYNSNVREYLNKLQTFPGMLFAGGFKKEEYFDLPDADPAQENVKVQF